MAESEESTRVSVKTYVPQYQKSEWISHAESLNMSQAEFVRTMVQAGRRGFEQGTTSQQSGSVEVASPDATPGVNGLKTRILEVINSAEYPGWDGLLTELSGNFEDRVEDAIAELEANNRIRYNPRNGGYERVDE
ncbi:DUF5805 domain-containing protein [Halalkalirubrum salinum]|uniref:DUF5805 domain-containing protein n=1 Tax=Halalkalirubrum salinum TaxID=2563889 RepID=UPI0010FAE8E7|nr:DUF5805 domain-containing protein [Halalkalirubrum salinum]